MISIIIPTLNEATQLPITLPYLAGLQGAFELIAVDGGSTDGTLSLLRQYPAIKVIRIPKAERAAQMNAGAQVAAGDILWFVHADTLVPVDSLALIRRACWEPGTVGGSFRMQFDRQEWPYRVLGWLTRFNSRWWTFGDQGIFVKRSTFEQLGGYPAMPMLEDLELQLQLRKMGKVVKLPAALITSARRYHHDGLWRELRRDVTTVVGYLLGMRVERLRGWYLRG